MYGEGRGALPPWEGFRPCLLCTKAHWWGWQDVWEPQARESLCAPRLGGLRGPLDSADQLAGVLGAWANISIQGSQVVPATRQVPTMRLQETLV